MSVICVSCHILELAGHFFGDDRSEQRVQDGEQEEDRDRASDKWEKAAITDHQSTSEIHIQCYTKQHAQNDRSGRILHAVEDIPDDSENEHHNEVES